ncbi:MAG: nucleotidyltransferase family protein [Solirubrobacteraceae bacterium]
MTDSRGAAGLVLAAGAGTRFRPAVKQLADLCGRPLLQWAIGAACAVRELSRVVVVVGAHADAVLAGVELGRAQAVVCEGWADGQSASLRCGLRALGDGVERVVVTLGDAPLVTPEVIALLASAPPRARAVYRGRPGHPVVLGADEIAAARSLRGDRGARELLRGGATIDVGHLCCGRDVDTPEDLEEIRDEARAVL